MIHLIHLERKANSTLSLYIYIYLYDDDHDDDDDDDDGKRWQKSFTFAIAASLRPANFVTAQQNDANKRYSYDSYCNYGNYCTVYVYRGL